MGDRRVEAFVGRHRAQVLPGLEHAVVELALGLEQVRLEYLQAMGQLLKQLLFLLRVQHMPFPPYPPVLVPPSLWAVRYMAITFSTGVLSCR